MYANIFISLSQNNLNHKIMKKKSIFLLSFLLMIITVGCSNDEDDLMNGGEVKAIYHALNQNGQETTVFNYGDEIQFELLLTNSTGHTLHYADELDFINGAFIVYDSKGQMFNPIVSQTFIYRENPVTVASGDQFRSRLIWPWNLVPLPVGKYHTTCTLDIDELSNKTYTIDFEIK